MNGLGCLHRESIGNLGVSIGLSLFCTDGEDQEQDRIGRGPRIDHFRDDVGGKEIKNPVDEITVVLR